MPLSKLPKNGPARKSVNTHRVGMKVVKPRKSVTMLELRRPPKSTNKDSDLNYVQIMESFGQDTNNHDGFDAKYRYLAYKTYCFMMKNAWKRAKDERQEALERVAKLQTSVLKTKTQLHVIKSLYHIERRHFDTASVQLHETKQKLVCVEGVNGELEKKLSDQDSSLVKKTNTNEKLHRDLDDVISKANRLEIQLDRKRDELSQLKNDNEFLIKQVRNNSYTINLSSNLNSTYVKDTEENRT